MRHAAVHIPDVARLDGDAVEHRQHFLYILLIECADPARAEIVERLESQIDVRVGIGIEDIPAFGFAKGGTKVLLGERHRRMRLNNQALRGIEQLQ